MVGKAIVIGVHRHFQPLSNQRYSKPVPGKDFCKLTIFFELDDRSLESFAQFRIVLSDGQGHLASIYGLVIFNHAHAQGRILRELISYDRLIAETCLDTAEFDVAHDVGDGVAPKQGSRVCLQ